MSTQKERLEFIVKEVNQSGEVSVSKLSHRFDCSEATIRNDIIKLDQKNLVKKVYGGAVKLLEDFKIEFQTGEIFQHKEKKIRIAEKAYSYIGNMDSIFIDDSTTAYYLAKYISQNNQKSISVVTNSIATAATLSNLSYIELFMLGGHVIGTPPATLDNISKNDLEQFYVNKAFVGTNGIDFEYGLTSIGLPQKNIKQKIISIARHTYVLVDSSKFGNRSLFPVCSVAKIHKLITDTDINEKDLAFAKKEKINIDCV